MFSVYFRNAPAAGAFRRNLLTGSVSNNVRWSSALILNYEETMNTLNHPFYFWFRFRLSRGGVLFGL